MPAHESSLRQRGMRAVILGGAVLLAAVAAKGAGAAADTRPVSRAGHSATRSRTALHQEVTFSATPQRVYSALLSSGEFASFTGMPAQIDPHVGGAISLFGGLIVGRNIELIPGKRIVQAWRPVEDFPPGVYSVVKIDLAPKGSGSVLALDHTGFPQGAYDHLNAGWPLRYWNPLKKHLAAARAHK